MIHIVCALPAEARPLIDHLRLKAVPDRAGYRCYANPTFCLVVSEVGAVNAAAATALLGAATDRAAWINLGVAGHGALPVGSAALAASVTDAATGRSWYPQFPFAAGLPRVPLLTVALPQDPLRCAGTLVDMEAAGFCAVASRYSSLELVHCLKMVSDNAGDPGRLSKQTVAELVASRLSALDELVDQLRALLGVLPAVQRNEVLLAAFTSRHRYSVSQTHELRRLLGRWRALGGEASVAPAQAANSAARALSDLRDRVTALARSHPLGQS